VVRELSIEVTDRGVQTSAAWKEQISEMSDPIALDGLLGANSRPGTAEIIVRGFIL
jgi:hypothetical protein